LSKLVGVTPRGMHTIMRNPIWMGWRVIDRKRDPSSGGLYKSINGRQTDRRKIKRSPEEIIRVKVIEEPILSEQEFATVQHIMDEKQQRHRRAREGKGQRFVYSGFLTCSNCGEPIHSSFQRRDYYVCRARRLGHTCNTRFMARERLEQQLDILFVERLTDRQFLEDCVDAVQRRSEPQNTEGRLQELNAQIAALRSKRERVIDAYTDGAIGREERDRRLAIIDRDKEALQGLMLQQEVTPRLDPIVLAERLACLAEWPYWTREQKRSVLAAMVPDIRVSDYHIESVGLRGEMFGSEESREDTGSWPPQA
jgi:hypothetical protein